MYWSDLTQSCCIATRHCHPNILENRCTRSTLASIHRGDTGILYKCLICYFFCFLRSPGLYRSRRRGPSRTLCRCEEACKHPSYSRSSLCNLILWCKLRVGLLSHIRNRCWSHRRYTTCLTPEICTKFLLG